jgi:hypothetical protein
LIKSNCDTRLILRQAAGYLLIILSLAGLENKSNSRTLLPLLGNDKMLL